MKLRRSVGNSLVVQWLGLCTFTAEDAGLIPDQGTKISQAAPLGVTCDQKKTQIFSFFVQCISLTHTL